MNNDENKAPFNISDYPREKYINGKGEEKERYIVPDEIFEQKIKELPCGTINESRTKISSFGGSYLKPLGNDPENDLKVRQAGAEATNAKLAQRRSFKEEVDILLSKTDKKTGKTGLESITLAQYERALTGDTKAYQALRDTAGEKPAETIDLSADIMTDEDRKLMERINKRLGE